MRTLGFWILGALLAGTLAGCCCCCNYEHSPVPYSEGNCYECGTCTFWGVGHYMQQYGFLHRPCNDPCNNCATAWWGAPAPAPESAPPPASRPYDTNPPVPPVPPVPAPEADDTDSPAPAP